MDTTEVYGGRSRVLKSIGVAFVLIAISFVLPQFNSKHAGEGSLSALDVVPVGIEADIDQDTLPEWQEYLWGTNPEAKDTDGDGMDDNMEIRAQRNPLVKGPNDKLTMTTGSTTYLFYEDDPAITTTDVIARDTYTAINAMKKYGTYSDEALLAFLSQLEKKAANREVNIVPLFDTKDILVGRENTPEDFRAYANRVAQVITTHKGEMTKDELVVFIEALKKNDATLLAPLEGTAKIYYLLAGELASLKVPSEVASVHLGLVNTYGIFAQSVDQMRFFTTDPVKYIGALASYKSAVENEKEHYLKLRDALIAKGTPFTDTDPGEQFFNIIQ